MSSSSRGAHRGLPSPRGLPSRLASRLLPVEMGSSSREAALGCSATCCRCPPCCSPPSFGEAGPEGQQNSRGGDRLPNALFQMSSVESAPPPPFPTLSSFRHLTGVKPAAAAVLRQIPSRLEKEPPPLLPEMGSREVVAASGGWPAATSFPLSREAPNTFENSCRKRLPSRPPPPKHSALAPGCQQSRVLDCSRKAWKASRESMSSPPNLTD
mmetsp:Transcript_14744/g.41513  ORF Transcript_14744/g.41513 Transcript_14744/m.41513 type:complete len:212 (+) Transcript_14744:549-1184(+)